MNNEITAYVHYHEYDRGKNHPTIVIQGDFGSRGFDVNMETGELKRVCICYAHSSNECICGAWDLIES